MEALDIGAMIKILSETIGQKVNAQCKNLNLTMQQMNILFFLKSREGKEETSQKDIQDYMRLSHPTVVNIIRLLKDKGFITTSIREQDRRNKIVSLTGKEEGFLSEMINNRERMEKLLVRGLTEKEQEDLRRYLVQMYQNITSGINL